MRVPLVNLLLVMLLVGSGCRKEQEKPEKPRATQPNADVSGGTIREGTGGSGARVTGGIFNDTPASQPTTRP